MADQQPPFIHQLQKQLEQEEGLRLKIYRDTKDISTIGYGRNLESVGISTTEALYLLGNDVTRVVADLDRELPWWRILSQNRRIVLADMCFNMGISKLLQFRKTIALIQAKRFPEAAIEMLKSNWAKQVGDRAINLSNMMKEG